MSAPPLSNTFNAGVQGATVASTDTGSGNPWDSVQIDAGGACIYDNAHTPGSMACKLTQPASLATIVTKWSGLGSLTGDVYHRVYLYLTANPVSFNIGFGRAFTSGLADCAHIMICPTAGANPGCILVHDANDANVAGLAGSVQMTLNNWVRIEWRINPSTTVGQFEWRLFNTTNSTTIDETKSVSGLVLGANEDLDWFGFTGNADANYAFWMDDIAVSTVGWIGPNRLPQVPHMYLARTAANF